MTTKFTLRRRWMLLIAIAVMVVIGMHQVHSNGRGLSPFATFHQGERTSTNRSRPIWQFPSSPLPSATITPVKPQGATVDAQRLWTHVQALAFARQTPEARQQAQDYIFRELHSLGWSPTLVTFNGGTNLVTQTSDASSRAGRILVAAHYDSVAESPGADDNASAVATVLEIARLFSDRQRHLGGHASTSRTLQLAFFDQEEQGALGSYAYANAPTNLTDLEAVIVVEMVGYACHTPGCQRRPQGLAIEPPTAFGDFLAVVGDAEHLPLLRTFEQVQRSDLPPLLTLAVPFKGVLTPDLLRSDHAPFWFQGIGAVMVTDTANFRNPHYHQPSDRPETLDRHFLTGAAQIVANATAALLESQTPLTTARSP